MRKLNVVLAGCGSISKAWLDAAIGIPEIEIVGLVDIQAQAAQTRAGEYQLHDALIETDLGRALDRLAPDIVFDCTVPTAHIGVTLEALRHGCHVFGEKPLADTLDHAQRMVEAAQSSGKIYAVMQNRRYDPNIRAIRSTLETGAIGPLTMVNSDFYIGAHIGGFRDHMEHVLLLDMAIHTFDAARFLMQADPVSVYCREWNPSGSWYDHDASAIAIFEMNNGSVYTYRGSWCAEGLATPWESDWRIIGQRGSLKWSGQDITAQRVASADGFQSTFENVKVEVTPTGESRSWHAHAIHDFIQCLNTGVTPQTICTDNIKSLAMVLSAIESANTGKTVKVEW